MEEGEEGGEGGRGKNYSVPPNNVNQMHTLETNISSSHTNADMERITARPSKREVLDTVTTLKRIQLHSLHYYNHIKEQIWSKGVRREYWGLSLTQNIA